MMLKVEICQRRNTRQKQQQPKSTKGTKGCLKTKNAEKNFNENL